MASGFIKEARKVTNANVKNRRSPVWVVHDKEPQAMGGEFFRHPTGCGLRASRINQSEN
jgi:hypothetical protein